MTTIRGKILTLNIKSNALSYRRFKKYYFQEVEEKWKIKWLVTSKLNFLQCFSYSEYKKY